MPLLSVGQRRHLRAHGVIAAIDVKQLAGGHGQVVRQESTCGSTDRRFVLQTPPERCAILPYLFEILESRNAARGERRQRTGANRVDTNLVAPEIACEVARPRFE